MAWRDSLAELKEELANIRAERLSQASDEDAEIEDIEEKIDLNEKLLLRLHETENDLLSNKILGVEERVLELQDRREDRREEIESEARKIEEEEEIESEARKIEEEDEELRRSEAENDDDSSEE